MAQLFKNNAFSALAASLTNAATTLTVTTGHGDRFPAVTGADFFMLTLQDSSNNVEIVKVTARTAGADSMTIARAQEGFTARSWNIGDVVELRVTAFALNPLSVFAGAATAQAMRDAMSAPSRTGGDASGTWAISISGNAATASAPASGGSFITSSNIGSQSVSYASTAGSATTAGTSGSCTGNAATATALQTARNINGVAFNGTANIDLPTVNTSGDQSVAGVKTFTGTYTAFAGVSGAYNGQVYIGGAARHIRSVTADNRWELVNANNTAVIFTFANNGDFTAGGNVTAYSDERLKKDWAPVQPGFLERLVFVKRGTYTRIDTGERQAGVSAQDFKRLLPEVVPEDAAGFLSLAYGNAALVAVIELTERVLELEERVKSLEAK